MPVTPPIEPPAIVPNYWSYTTLSFNRSQEYPDNPEYSVGIFANDLHVYDINGDGNLDILQVYAYIPGQDLPGIPIRILLGDGQGNFTDGTASLFPGGAPLGDAATGSVVADFNGDGVLDIFIGMTWETLEDIQRSDILLLSDGNGGVIDASGTLPNDANDYTHWSSGADIDGDGDIDLYVGNLGGTATGPDGDLTSHFLINDGTGNFVRSDTRLPATIENGNRTYTSNLLFDADNDGDPDLLLGMWPQWVVIGSAVQPSLLLFNDGTGNFVETAGSILPDPLFALNKAVMLDMDDTDLNGDGYADLVMLTADFDAGYGVQVLINNGDGTFRDETASRMPDFVSGTAPTDGDPLNHRYIHLTDFSGDGVIDLVLETGGSSRFYLNDGIGHFVRMPDDFLYAGAAAGGYGFVPGDFNEDGRTDFFVRIVINFWDDADNVTEFDRIALWNQPTGTVLSGNEAANAVLGTALAETLSGLGGNDVLSGGAGNDSLSGGSGADTLIGGAGNDMFRDTAADLNADTIRDFTASDRIVITGATLTGFTFSLTGSTLTYTGGTLTLSGGVSGTLVASAAIEGGVQLTIVPDVRNDFNGDGRSDILWRNVDGQMSNWLGQANGGFTPNNANAAAVVPTAWKMVGTGDFNGDGRDDILWRHTDGTLSNWLGTAAGGYTPNDANAAVVVPTDWQVVGTGDFNGDGRDDILWRNVDGTLSNWLGQANGGFVANDANAAAPVPTDWKVAGVGDFNGDGRDDILWRNVDGQLSNWLGTANGGFTPNNENAAAVVPTAWAVVGTGDFNGDGRDDILWRNTDGTLSNWLATVAGGYVANDANAAVVVPLDWSVVATGDYNGDGRDDILWRNNDGTLSDWLGNANGGFTPNDANAAAPVPTSWIVQPEPFLL